MSGNELTYKASGVDVGAGDAASRVLYEAARTTWVNRLGRLGEIQTQAADADFRGSRFSTLHGMPSGACFGMNFDGIGTKVEIAERLGRWDTLAFDLFAMVCDDAAIQGAEPVHVGSIIDTAHIDEVVVGQLATGMIAAARSARVAVINGEIAELSGRVAGYGAYPLNWGAACFWVAKRSTLDSWTAPLPGDVVIGIVERGVRSNGLSLVRKILEWSGGASWHVSDPAIRDLAEFALTPSTIYTPFIVECTGGTTGEPRVSMRTMLHITGGGLAGRIRHYCARHHIGAVLTPPPPPAGLTMLQKLGGISAYEAYQTWNMGLGLVIVAPPESVETLLGIAADFQHPASVIGNLVDSRVVTIEASKEMLSYDA